MPISCKISYCAVCSRDHMLSSKSAQEYFLLCRWSYCGVIFLAQNRLRILNIISAFKCIQQKITNILRLTYSALKWLDIWGRKKGYFTLPFSSIKMANVLVSFIALVIFYSVIQSSPLKKLRCIPLWNIITWKYSPFFDCVVPVLNNWLNPRILKLIFQGYGKHIEKAEIFSAYLEKVKPSQIMRWEKVTTF